MSSEATAASQGSQQQQQQVNPDALHSDTRICFIGHQVLETMRSASKESLLELLSCEGFEESVVSLFEQPTGCLCIYAVSGDQFDNPDRKARRSRPYIQRLRFSANGTPEDSTSSRSVQCVFFAKATGPVISAQDAEGWDITTSENNNNNNRNNNSSEETAATVVLNLNADHIVNQFIETMSCESPSLLSLQATLQRVYLPLFDEIKQVGATSVAASSTLHGEVVAWTKRLSQQVGGLLSQVSAERTLPMPAVPIIIGESEADIKAASANEEIVQAVDQVVSQWNAEISATLRAHPQKEGPLGEIEFWKEKYSALSGLYEQVNSPKVNLILKVAKQSECNAWHAISTVLTRLTKDHNDAKDNVRFLGTLDRQFRTITNVTPEGGTLQPILDVMASMMLSLKVVWTLSRCYSKEEQMGELLEKIAQLIAKKVAQHVDHRTILSQPFGEARRKIEEGYQVLTRWKECYNNVQRDTAANAETGEVPWSFDQRMLFETTDYMSLRCDEIYEIVNDLEYFYRVLGGQLKSMLSETTEIEGILRDLEKIKKPIETMSFDPFEKKAVHHWHLMHGNFKASLQTLEAQVGQFIHHVFDNELKSAEVAFNFYQDLKTLDSRKARHLSGASHAQHQQQQQQQQQAAAAAAAALLEEEEDEDEDNNNNGENENNNNNNEGEGEGGGGGQKSQRKKLLAAAAAAGPGKLDIKKIVSTKADRVMQQFLIEIKKAEDQFHALKEKPPLTKNQPKIAGAIHWAYHAMYKRLKDQVLRYQEEGMLKTEVGQEVKKAYAALCKTLKLYWLTKYKDWTDEVTRDVSERLRWKILERVEGSDDMYRVHFDKNLFETIKEATYLDRLGFEVPADALNVTLQDEAYHNYVESLTQMLTTFNQELALVHPNERDIMLSRINKLKEVLKPGVEDLNWLSLGITEFIQKCNGEITEFRNFARDIRKNVGALNTAVVQRIAGTQLVPDISHFTSGPQVMELQQVQDELERYRKERLDLCVRAYQGAHTALKNIELLVEPPTSPNVTLGKSQLLASTDYYYNWERKIHKAILRMVVNSLLRFCSLLGYSPKGSRSSFMRKPPLFRVQLFLDGQEIKQSPPKNEVLNIVTTAATNIGSSGKRFCRWLHNQCIESSKGKFDAPPEGMDLAEIYTFADDIGKEPSIWKINSFITGQILQKIGYAVKTMIGQTGDGLKDWAQENKELSVEEQSKLNYHWVDYYTKFRKFTEVIEGLDEEPKLDKVGFMLIDKDALWKRYVWHVFEWLRLYGKQLAERYKNYAAKLETDINAFAEDLHKYDTQEFEDLQKLLKIMDDACSQSLHIETRYREIEFVYDTLFKFKHKDSHVPEEAELAYALRGKWQAVLREVNTKNVQLIPQKVKFRRQTAGNTVVFARDIKDQLEEFRKNGPGREELSLDEAVALKNHWRAETDKMLKLRSDYAVAEKLLGLEISTYPNLQTLNEELTLVEFVLKLYEDWMIYQRKWSKLLWVEVRIEDMQKITDEKLKEGRKVNKTHGQIQPFPAVQRHIQDFHASLPLLTKLKSPALKGRHWKELMVLTKKSFNHEHITLEDLVALELHNCVDEVELVVSTAGREAGVEKEIQKIKDYWASKEFLLVPYQPNPKKPSRVNVLSDTTDIQEVVDEDILKISGLTNVKWAEPFIEEVKLWGKKLDAVNRVVGLWGSVQVQWQYLESIFTGSEDIINQLPKEAAKFKDLDKRWVRTMDNVTNQANVEQSCNAPERLEDLKYVKEKLDECQKDLSKYLMDKRDLFPRLFFLADEELLMMLSTTSPVAVQEHMLKMFDNSALLLFKGDTTTIEGVQSQEGEVVMFENVVQPDGIPVETWLQLVLDETRRSLRGILKAAVFYYPKQERLNWVEKYHGMVTLAGAKIWWTFQIEDAFAKVKKGRKNAVKDLLGKLSSQLDELVAETTRDLSKQYRKKVNTLIILDVHGRDIVGRFVRDSILDVREFDWESQLRYYWEKSADTCKIHQCTGVQTYGYEYQGLNGRLIITPLTDRCFMTLTQALAYNLGGSPGGPAGTGKTESVKDLAKAIGLHCVVQNCGDGLDYKAMGSIFSGLSQAGSWGCFDEFNRIDLPVLSVVSEQLRRIQDALKRNVSRFMFEGREIALKRSVGVFVTMNPGYAGRVELPDNLKALFRPVVMVVPDMELIAENMLFSEGFTTARELAKKMVTLYSLAKGQLSKQYHYDWGLRALKAVLVMAGALKRGSPKLAEKEVLMRALRDMNSPKFVAEDEPLFKGLLADLFPGLDPTRVLQENLSNAAKRVLKENGYIYTHRQVDKVVQLYETMQTRHTTMIVGPSGGGKSVVIRTLQGAQEILNLPTKLFIINPKAQPTSLLYGSLDPMTRSWCDGIFSNVFRNINKVTKDGSDRERKYVVFDGDVDAKWVEDLNSVMDDNKLLTLPNGERIRLHPTCALLYEVGDLQYASPATVSRVGMVFLDPQNLGWTPFMEAWLQRRNKDEAEQLRELVDKYVPPLTQYVVDGFDDGVSIGDPIKLVLPNSDLNMVRQLSIMLQTMILPKLGVPEPKNLESIFIFACMWSFGALISDATDRERFDIFMKKITGWQTQDNGDNMERWIGAGTLPEKRTLYEYLFDVEDMKWKPWRDLRQEYVPPSNGKFNSILVSTEDTERSKWLLGKIIANRTPILFVGESGTAKTVTIQAFLRELKAREKTVNSEGVAELDEVLLEMNFSSRTSGYDAQRSLDANVERKTSTLLGPAQGKRLVAFVDDINMPIIDTYGTQQVNAFLKLLIDQGGWYDRKELIFKHVRDTQFLAACAPPGGGRNPLDPRFVSLFSVFNVAIPDHSSLRLIYEAILNGRLDEVGVSYNENGLTAEKITNMTLGLYKSICKDMLATPKNFHYVFNLRDLSRIYQGLYRVTLDKFSTEQSLLRLWRNEVTRVFADRMAVKEDKEKVFDLTTKLIVEHFPVNADYALQDPLLFADFGDFEPDSDKKRLHLYEDFGADFTRVRRLLEAMLEEINTPVMKMDLVMFDMAVEHLLRIIRVINVSRGHCLLVGVGGSGKQSLAKLAAAVSEMSVFEIALSRGYNEESFREDLKKLYFRVGVDNEKVVFLFMDLHVKQEGFLELINNMLASGMVPALFPDEEKEPLYQAVRGEFSGGFAPTDQLWDAFVNRCRDNLHIVLAMTPSGDTLRTRCRNFPAIINCTTCDWYTKWPAQALSAVAAKHLAQEDLPDYLRIPITEYFVYVHTVADDESVRFFANLKRRNFVTPKNFLAFLANYSKILSEKRIGIDEISMKLKTGLEKLHKANEDVSKMQSDLAEKEVDLAEKTRKNNEMIAETEELKAQNEVKVKEASQTELELGERNIEIEKDEAEASKVLEDAMPAVNAAKEALEHLEKSKIDELKAFANPPDRCVSVARMICVLFESDKVSWDGGRVIMNRASFISDVKGYNLPSLLTKPGERKMRDVAAIVKELGGASINDVKKSSVAAAELYRWVRSLQDYFAVAKKVAPLQQRVEHLREDKREMEENLMNIKNEIEFRNDTVRSLTIRLEAGVEEARRLQEETAIMQRRLDAARRLINGFTSERKRWHLELDELKEARKRLVGDSLLGAGFMSYLGAFTFSYRNETLYEHWVPDLKQRKVPFTDPFSIPKLFTNEVELSSWASNGLPMDELSVQNGILTVEATGRGSVPVSHSKKNQPAASQVKQKQGKVRFPLMIDPQKQAVNWIKRTHAENSRFEVATFSDPDFLKRLEFCIQYGIPFLFENVDEFIDPIIDAVLDPQFRVDSGQKMIKIGDKDISWDDNFKLYLCTKLANPNYTAEVFGKTLVVNYSVTQDGLESQLLNEVVAIERVNLQTQSEELVQTMAENRAQLKQLEDSLIRELTLATGNILDNDELIETLENTKSSAADVTQKLEQATAMAKETEQSRQEYRPVARRGAVLFFVMAQLSHVNSMYEYSLSAFLNDVFKHSIHKSENAFETKDRLDNIIEYLNYCVYRYVCLGIFEKHKLTFALQMTFKLLFDIDALPPTEADFFIRGCVLASKEFPENASQGMLTDGQWNDICLLAQTCETFHKLVAEVRENHDEWQVWMMHDRPEDPATQMPCGYNERVTAFQKLMLLRCFRPDRVYIAVGHFISKCELMGERFTIPPILKYSEVYKQSSCTAPIVCIVSPGANPTDEISKLADKVFGEDQKEHKFKAVSLGQGQGEHALHLYDNGATRGHWVLLANAHLLVDFLRELEKVMERRDQHNKPHSEFRLWLTTEPSLQFPLGILQRSLKVVNEPPNGLKMNMKNTFARITEGDLEECNHPAFRPLMYTLAFFHAVVQERRKYGKMGWNVIYDFNETDFSISMRLSRTYLDKAVANGDPIPWDTLRYLTGEAMYGGRVSDNFDRRIVKSYLEEYFGEFLFDTFQVFHFFKDENSGVDYCLPPGSCDFTTCVTLEDMNNHIQKMPLENTPDVFGLHPNAETNYLRNAADYMWDTLKELMPKVTVSAAAAAAAAAGGGSESARAKKKESEAAEAAAEKERQKNEPQVVIEDPVVVLANDILDLLAPWNDLISGGESGRGNTTTTTSATAAASGEGDSSSSSTTTKQQGGGGDGGPKRERKDCRSFDRKAVMKQQLDRSRLLKQDGLQPTQVVLMQELERWNQLVNTMIISLNLLLKALAGTIGMSAELDELAASLTNGALPSQWRKCAPATRKSLGRWLVHFERRFDQFDRWRQMGEPPCLWLSGLMVPDSYISALVQITCRKYVWPLDKSTVFTQVSNFTNPEDIKEPPKDGAYICGLYLEGARYDMSKKQLATQEKKVLIRELPVLEIIPQESSKVKLVGTFRTPVYVTRDRRNAAGVGLVFEADLATDEHYSHWVLESVALMLNSDD